MRAEGAMLTRSAFLRAASAGAFAAAATSALDAAGATPEPLGRTEGPIRVSAALQGYTIRV